MIDVTNNKIDASYSISNESLKERDSQIYELVRAEQVFSHNETAKFEIAIDLHSQGITIEAISRILDISQEELFAEFDS